MLEFIKRKKRKHTCKVYFNNDSFCLNGCKIAPVHVIPKKILPNQEFDFYIETSYDVYLLRLTNSSQKRGVICPARKYEIIYIICFLPINRDNITLSIINIMHSLNQYGFPKIHNPQHKLSFTIQC